MRYLEDLMNEMQKFSDFRPTQFDVKGLGSSEKPDWRVAPCSVTRDSGILETSNWETMVNSLEEIDPDGETWEIHRFGHWGPGWFEVAIVKPGSQAHEECARIGACLSDYPVLDDADYSRREWEAAEEGWNYLNRKERIQLCGECKVSIFAARRDEIPDGIELYKLTGEY